MIITLMIILITMYCRLPFFVGLINANKYSIWRHSITTKDIGNTMSTINMIMLIITGMALLFAVSANRQRESQS